DRIVSSGPPRQADRNAQEERVREQRPGAEAYEGKRDPGKRQPAKIARDRDRQLRKRQSDPADGDPAEPGLVRGRRGVEADDPARCAAVVYHEAYQPERQRSDQSCRDPLAVDPDQSGKYVIALDLSRHSAAARSGHLAAPWNRAKTIAPYRRRFLKPGDDRQLIVRGRERIAHACQPLPDPGEGRRQRVKREGEEVDPRTGNQDPHGAPQPWAIACLVKVCESERGAEVDRRRVQHDKERTEIVGQDQSEKGNAKDEKERPYEGQAMQDAFRTPGSERQHGLAADEEEP